jgi:uncharacterized LabA/DUF88 family protein
MMALFIDGSYLWRCWQEVGTGNIDFLKLRRALEIRLSDEVVERYYFDAILGNGNSRAQQLAAIARAGFRVKARYRVAEETTRAIGGETVRVLRQKGVDVGLALSIERSHARNNWDRLILAAGDADFSELVQDLVERRAVELTLVGLHDHISADLLPYARRTITLLDLYGEIGWNSNIVALERDRANKRSETQAPRHVADETTL